MVRAAHRPVDLPETLVFPKVHSERCGGGSLEIPGKRAVKSQQRKRSSVGLDNVTAAGLDAAF